MLSELKCQNNDNIYITEQLTPFYNFLNTKFDNLWGSEYLGENLVPGEINQNGVRHEDLTNLSFEDNSKDIVMSFDCLEHIPDYQKAIAEIYRVLKIDGKLLISFPFDKNRESHLVRAKVNDDGIITHLEEPEYHGDPINNKGCLSFYTFGWDILQEFKNAGFKEAYSVNFWSDKYGYLGDEQIAFIAIK